MQGLLPPEVAAILDLEDGAGALELLPAQHRQELLEWIARADSTEAKVRRLAVALRTLEIAAHADDFRSPPNNRDRVA